jgi:copper ion binding protein
MRTLIKTLLTLGVATALPSMTRAGGEACAAAAGTCPATAAAKAGECCSATAAKAGECCAATGATAAAKAAKNDKLVKVDYKIAGMSGDACAAKLTKTLAAIEGVSEPAACSESKHAKLAYNPAKVKDDQLIAAINKAGFKVEAETIAVKVDGMSCGACSDKVSKKLASVKGVSEQKVCHESKQAVITFDPAKVSRKDVLAAIDTTGFKVAQ